MNLLLRLSHASTAFDYSGNLMHDTFVFANYSIFQEYSRGPLGPAQTLLERVLHLTQGIMESIALNQGPDHNHALP